MPRTARQPRSRSDRPDGRPRVHATGSGEVTAGSRRVVLHISPHPDDELIGAPATLFALRDAGWHVIDLACSLGRVGQRTRRRAELGEACRRAGFELVVPGKLPGIGAADDPERAQLLLAELIADQLRLHPGCVLAGPSPHDGHHGHEVVGRAIVDAAESAGRGSRWLIWGLWAELPFPNLLIEFGRDRMGEIKRALAAHAGEVARNDYAALVESRARTNAILGPERVHGFGSRGSRMPFAELLTHVNFTGNQWELPASRDFAPQHVLDETVGTPIGWWLHAESAHTRLRANARRNGS